MARSGLRLKVTGQGQDAVGLTSILDREQFCSLVMVRNFCFYFASAHCFCLSAFSIFKTLEFQIHQILGARGCGLADIVIQYVLPVLWMTSCFYSGPHGDVMLPQQPSCSVVFGLTVLYCVILHSSCPSRRCALRLDVSIVEGLR